MKKEDVWVGPSGAIAFEEGLNFIKYESDMLAFTHLHLHSSFISEIAQAHSVEFVSMVNYSLLESFLLHFRALREFFETHPNERKIGPRGEDHTVLSSDYGFGLAKLKWLDKRTRIRLNKDLAHIDYDRGERKIQGKEWDTNLMLRKMKEALELFNKHVASLGSSFPANRYTNIREMELT